MMIDLREEYDFHQLTDHLTSEEKSIWYNGFEKAMSLYFNASQKVSGVFRLPEESGQLMNKMLEQMEADTDDQMCNCADVPCGGCNVPKSRNPMAPPPRKGGSNG